MPRRWTAPSASSRSPAPARPLVAEFCVAELALALGVSTDSGKRYLGDAVETHYRLPRLWARVMAGEVPVWKARQVATRTIGLSAGRSRGSWTSTSHPSRTAARTPQIDRSVEEARARFDPDEAEAKRAEQAEQRHVDIRLNDVTTDGLVYIEATTDLADALAFEAQPSQPKPTSSSRPTPTCPSTSAGPWPSATSATWRRQ